MGKFRNKKLKFGHGSKNERKNVCSYCDIRDSCEYSGRGGFSPTSTHNFTEETKPYYICTHYDITLISFN
ncbi:MAG: hypothetical protein KJ697_00325 [Nanoarchaeota archaeon]|nr:hypothetical protein [Nanoarchaeota archaeon]MBU4124233.1 hypothetical protein [Nanoarchaeota archaeon]